MKVTYEDHMGNDLKVANAARVSFGKRSEYVFPEDRKPGDVLSAINPKWPMYLKEADARLIGFLARGCTTGDWEEIISSIASAGRRAWGGDEQSEEDLMDLLNELRSMPTHWTPFGHCQITLIIKAPIFVARQLFKHKVGSVENEVSRRYVTDEPEFWTPEEWRAASDDKKQGSGGALDVEMHEYLNEERNHFLKRALGEYQHKLACGVCPEQARADLPQSMYTEWWVTGSLYYWASLYNARIRSDAQKETQQVASMVGDILSPLYPVAWKALTQ